VIDPVNSANVYVNCGNEILKSISGGHPGESWFAVQAGINQSDRANPVYPPLTMDPSNDLTLYAGTYRVYQSRDASNNWAVISPDLTRGSGALSTIAVAPADSNTVYAGTDDGKVQVTTNASAGRSAIWTDRTPGLPNRSVTWIAVDQVNPLIAYVALSGFSGFGDNQGHVFKTTSGGSGWTDISGNIPNIPANCITLDPDNTHALYLATDIGVFATMDGGTTWAPLGSGLPRVAVMGLQVHHSTRILRAATHGRSMWDLQLPAPPPPAIGTAPSGLQFSYTPGAAVPAAQTIQISNGGGGTLTWGASPSAPWITFLPTTGTAPSALSVSVNPATLAAGNYTGTIKISSSLASASQVTVNLTVSSAGPSILAGGVVPLFSSTNTIEPGSWISIYGNNLVPGASATWNGSFQNSTSLGGVSVTIDGKPAYISSVTKGTPPNPDQINAEAPDDTVTGPVAVVVTNSLGSSSGSTVTLATFAPSFSLLDNKHVAGIILTPDGSGAYGNGTYDIPGPVGAFSYPTRPVKTGETLILFGVGFGPTTTPVPAGIFYSGAAQAANNITMTIGGVSVPIGFAGISYTGQYQFNLVMPEIPGGDQLIVASVGGVQSPANFVITAQ